MPAHRGYGTPSHPAPPTTRSSNPHHDDGRDDRDDRDRDRDRDRGDDRVKP